MRHLLANRNPAIQTLTLFLASAQEFFCQVRKGRLGSASLAKVCDERIRRSVQVKFPQSLLNRQLHRIAIRFDIYDRNRHGSRLLAVGPRYVHLCDVRWKTGRQADIHLV